MYPRASELEEPIRECREGWYIRGQQLLLQQLLKALAWSWFFWCPLSLVHSQESRVDHEIHPLKGQLTLSTVRPLMHHLVLWPSIHPHWLGIPCLTSRITLHIILIIKDGTDFAELTLLQDFSYKKNLISQFLLVEFEVKAITNCPLGTFPQIQGWEPDTAVIYHQNPKLRWVWKLLCYPWLK